jgi:hypothetical protein
MVLILRSAPLIPPAVAVVVALQEALSRAAKMVVPAVVVVTITIQEVLEILHL